MTRIALMVNCLATGGAETQLVRLAVELRRAGHEVGVVPLLEPAAFTDVLAASDVPLITPGAGPRHGHGDRIAKTDVVRGIVATVRALRRWRPDALVCFIHEASLYGRFVGRLAGVPVVIGSERNIWREGRIDAVVSRWTDRLLTTTVVNAPAVRHDLVQRRIVRPEAVHVIPNGIDVSGFSATPAVRAAVRAEVGVADDAFVWLAVGRLTPQKDFATLLAAFARVAADRADARLLIAGSGALHHDLVAGAAEAGLADRVTFLGERGDVPRLLAAADALVVSSEAEGLPNVVMEAFAAALPVVATDVGGVADLVVPDRTGHLVPARDPSALAAGMLQMMAAPADRRAALGRAGHQLIRLRYGMPEVARRWAALIVGHVDAAGGRVALARSSDLAGTGGGAHP